jgi:hypothetical protein
LISGIIEIAGNRKLNLGAQSLAGKILMSKNLAFALEVPTQAKIELEWTTRQNGTDALSAHRHGLDDDRAIAGLCARSDVTLGLWKRKSCEA